MPEFQGICYLQAAAAENTYRRKSRGRGVKKRWSVYKFGVFATDENGERYVSSVITHEDGSSDYVCRDSAHVVNTAVWNRASGNATLLYSAVDLDYKSCSKRWITRKKIDWKKIESVLKAEHPFLFSAISRVVTSHGKRGLHIWIPISPLLLTDRYKKIQDYARALQRLLHQFFSHYEMGLDHAASGLAREFANFFDESKVVYKNDLPVRRAHGNNRAPIIRELVDYLGSVKFCGYQKKSEDQSLLYHDARIEHKLAQLYLKAYEAWSEGEDLLMTQTQLVSLTGLSVNTAKKFLKGGSKLRWLFVSEDDDRLWKFSFNPNSSQLLLRAEALVRDGKTDRKLDMSRELVEPCFVADGERNDWIARASVYLKWKGIEEDRAYDIIDQLAAQIPGSEGSRNCKCSKNTVRSIYRSQRFIGTFASREEMVLPLWLEHPQLALKNFTQTVTSLQKGLQGGGLECSIESHDGVTDIFISCDTKISLKLNAADVGKTVQDFPEGQLNFKKDTQTYGSPPGGQSVERAGAQFSSPDLQISTFPPKVSSGLSDSSGVPTPPLSPFDFSVFSGFSDPARIALLQVHWERSSGEVREKLQDRLQSLAQKAEGLKVRKPRKPLKNSSDPLLSIVGRFGKTLDTT